MDSLAQSPSFLFLHIFLAVHLVNELLELYHVCFLSQTGVLRMLSIPVTTEQFATNECWDLIVSIVCCK